ncbi:hypothetical protein SDRG_01825 [Saprolegnia diclina VS20]|uniref:DUF6604 domain-containing protein n=1 Tax=Saprolegnia diclina (strain VS20) TaxID=1156394 RepID=T0QRI4_SAPDV|nr:hypothetical protein SDRG_01825 [Saprolegnia diclina VS20]EQC40754.1 hypothetical protein SDRG_01825 [Saprolegnia diclina VS20]|eukprot:XP_008605598.1 hypothetical protein SDRG_01825 [Saprolegnia diclina VS20]
MAATGPTEPSGRWHRYKAATDAFLGWLQRTAAKKTKKIQATNEVWTTGQIWAAAIAVAEAGVPVPTDVWRHLATSIRLRWQASQCLPSEEGHLYFLNVLRAIQAMLTPRGRPPTATKGLSNVFEALALDDTADDADADLPPFDGATFVPPPAPTSEEAARASRQAQLEADRFHTLCFLRDMYELLDEVEAVWTAFKRGETSLVAATAVTNHCVIAVQSLFSELTLEVPYIESIECMDVLLSDNASLQHLVFQQDVPLDLAVTTCVHARNADNNDGNLRQIAQSWTRSEEEATELHAFFKSELSALLPTRHGSHLMLVHHYFKKPSRDVTGELNMVSAAAFEELTWLFVGRVVPRLAVSVQTDALKLVSETVGLSPFLPVLKVYLDNKIGIAPLMLVFAISCLLRAMAIVDGPGRDTITVASVAATIPDALKQQFKSVLLCRQGRRAERATANNKPDTRLDTFLATVSASHQATLGVVTKDRKFASDANRARWWLNPYMAGQFLLTGATHLNGAPGHVLLCTSVRTRLVLHVYNALRVCGHVQIVPELEKLIDLFGSDKHMWPAGRPTAPGAFTTGLVMTDGAPMETMALLTAITSAPFERASEAFEAATAYREKRDRRNKLQKAQNKSTLRKRKTINATYADQCRTYRYATRAEPLPLGASLPNMREIRRVVDDEWRRFLHLDLIAVHNILVDVAKDIIEVASEAPPLLSGKKKYCHRLDWILTQILGSCDFGVGTAMLHDIANILEASNSKLLDAHILHNDL